MSMAALQPVSKPSAWVVMGVSGCGKTAVGTAIAERLGVEFIEGDRLHPEANIAKMSKGIPLTDEDRFPWLDRIGIEMAAALERGESVVVSCSSLKRDYRDRLRRHARGRLTFIFLDGTREVLAARLAGRSGHFMPASLLESQFAALEAPAGEEGVITVDIAGTQAQVIETALAELGKSV